MKNQKGKHTPFSLADIPEGKVRYNVNLLLKETPSGEEGQKLLKEAILMMADVLDEHNGRISHLGNTKKDVWRGE